MDWAWLLGDAEFYVRMGAEAIGYVLVVAAIFATLEKVMASLGLWDPRPFNKR